MTSVTDRPRARLSPKQLRERLRSVRREHAIKARLAREQLAEIPQQLPETVRAVFDPLAPAFARPTHQRFVLRALAAILTLGGRTIANLLRVLGGRAPGHPRSDHRVFARDRWALTPLARRSVAAVRARFAPHGPVLLAGDDTVTEHPGPHVYGTGRHRDPVRSTHADTAFRWGHQWVVLALFVPVPGATRRGALPLWVALYRPQEENQKPARRHKTPPQLLGQMVRILMRGFPERTFVITADGGYATHERAELTARVPRRLTLISRFSPDAHLVEPPPKYAGKGRPRVQGKNLPSPAEVVQSTAQRPTRKVAWYGGGRRRVEVGSGTGLGYQSGRPLVNLKWVFVHDRTGTHRNESFFTTDVKRSIATVIETSTGRWNMETTFQEVRSYLRGQTTRGWSRDMVLRVGPCLFGLYTVVAWRYAELPTSGLRVRVVDWPGKRDVTFSDAITAVRRGLWREGVWTIPGHRDAFQTLAPGLQQRLLNGLAPAA